MDANRACLNYKERISTMNLHILKNSRTIFHAEEKYIQHFLELHTKYDYVLPFFEERLKEDIEWRYAYNYWLNFVLEDHQLNSSKVKDKIQYPTKGLFYEIICRPEMKKMKKSIDHNEFLSFITSVALTIEMMNFFRQYMQQNDKQVLLLLLHYYKENLHARNDSFHPNLTHLIFEYWTGVDDLLSELDHCITTAWEKAKALYELLYGEGNNPSYEKILC